MKKVILIGEFNEVTKHISGILSPYCQVQLCADNVDIVEGMLKLFVPDLMIISLVGTHTIHEEIFSLLSREVPDVPLMTIGFQSDEEDLTDAGFLPDERIRFLRRPIQPEDLVVRVKEILKINDSDDLPGKQKKILVVDDSPTMLRTVQFMLTGKYKVTFATSGPQAIASIAKSKPDLILLDYDMPVCDGKMTLQMLRSEEDTKDIPVVFLTGYSDSEHVKEILAFLPQGYLLKPPAVNRLRATIEEVLAEAEKKEQSKGRAADI